MAEGETSVMRRADPTARTVMTMITTSEDYMFHIVRGKNRKMIEF